ncbi:thiamine-monophosphate kinase [Fibrobacterales bacterium]|nr:thiamine-monophosphate kinase [Fibrobacterales bacterium]
MFAKGIGDDAFVAGDYLISADMSVEETHFIIENGQPASVKNAVEKCLLANFSDINAMGGISKAILFSVCINKNWNKKIRTEIANSVAEICKKHKVKIIGGDTTGGTLGVFSITVFGKKEGRVLLRSAAKTGDDIWVSGTLGLSAASNYSRVPNPPLKLGAKLSKIKGIGACIDLSDSLSDCLNILSLQSKARMVLEEKLIEVKNEFWLNGGEDYELLFTARKSARTALEKIPNINRIGEVKKGAGCILITKNGKEKIIKPSGWRHF